MVVVGFNRDIATLAYIRGWCDFETIGQFINDGAEFSQLAGQVADAVGLFVADMSHAPDRRRAAGEQGDRG